MFNRKYKQLKTEQDRFRNETNEAIIELKKEIFKINNPPKYKIGDKQKGGVIISMIVGYDPEMWFRPHLTWMYRVLKEDDTNEWYNECDFKSK